MTQNQSPRDYMGKPKVRSGQWWMGFHSIVVIQKTPQLLRDAGHNSSQRGPKAAQIVQ